MQFDNDRSFKKYNQWKSLFIPNNLDLTNAQIIILGTDNSFSKYFKTDFPDTNVFFLNCHSVDDLKNLLTQFENKKYDYIIPNRMFWGNADSPAYQLMQNLYQSLIGKNIKELNDEIKKTTGDEKLTWSVLQELVL